MRRRFDSCRGHTIQPCGSSVDFKRHRSPLQLPVLQLHHPAQQLPVHLVILVEAEFEKLSTGMNAVRPGLEDGHRVIGHQPRIAIQSLVDVHHDPSWTQFDAAEIRAVVPRKDGSEPRTVFIDDHAVRAGAAHLDALHERKAFAKLLVDHRDLVFRHVGCVQNHRS